MRVINVSLLCVHPSQPVGRDEQVLFGGLVTYSPVTMLCKNFHMYIPSKDSHGKQTGQGVHGGAAEKPLQRIEDTWFLVLSYLAQVYRLSWEADSIVQRLAAQAACWNRPGSYETNTQVWGPCAENSD